MLRRERNQEGSPGADLNLPSRARSSRIQSTMRGSLLLACLALCCCPGMGARVLLADSSSDKALWDYEGNCSSLLYCERQGGSAWLPSPPAILWPDAAAPACQRSAANVT